MYFHLLLSSMSESNICLYFLLVDEPIFWPFIVSAMAYIGTDFSVISFIIQICQSDFILVIVSLESLICSQSEGAMAFSKLSIFDSLFLNIPDRMGTDHVNIRNPKHNNTEVAIFSTAKRSLKADYFDIKYWNITKSQYIFC